MRTSLQVILVIAALIIVPTVGLLIYLSFADLTVHKEYFEDEFSEALGHDVSFGGLFDLQVGRQVIFTVEDVSASNPEWTEDSEYFAAERIHLLIDGWSVIGDSIEIDAVELSGVQMNLREDVEGRGNWEPNLTEIQTVAVDFDDNEEISVILHHLALDEFNLSFEAEGAAEQQVTIDTLQVDRDASGEMNLASAGTYADGTLLVPFTTTGVVHFQTSQLHLGNTSIILPGGEFVVDGSLGFDGTGTLDLVAEGDDLSDLGDTFGSSGLPGLPYSFSAQLSATADAIGLEDIQFAIGEGKITGSVTLELDQARPHIVANISSPFLDLRGPESVVSEEETGDTAPERIFSDELLAYSWLDSVNVDAGISVASIFLADDRLEDLNFNIVVADGALTLDPFGFSSGEGELFGRADLRPNNGQHSLSLTAATNNLRLGALAIEGQERDTIPPLDLELQFAGEGTTIREIVGSANGNISGRQGAGQINLQAAGVLFSDLVTSVLRTLNPLAETETVTAMECGVYKVNITDGIAVIEELALQTDLLTIIGSGDINLATEEIDLSLRTKTREGLGVSLGGVVNSFLKVGGTLNEPSLGVDTAGSVTTTGAAVATGGLSLLARGLWDRVSAEADICSQSQEDSAEIE